MSELLRAILRGGPGDGAIVQFAELPMDLYWEFGSGNSGPYYLKGDVRVMIPTTFPIHCYQRSFMNDIPPEGIWCFYDHLGVVEEKDMVRRAY